MLEYLMLNNLHWCESLSVRDEGTQRKKDQPQIQCFIPSFSRYLDKD